jgi:hypothetical protein
MCPGLGSVRFRTSVLVLIVAASARLSSGRGEHFSTVRAGVVDDRIAGSGTLQPVDAVPVAAGDLESSSARTSNP